MNIKPYNREGLKSDIKKQIPYWVIAICVLPFALNLVGFEFGSNVLLQNINNTIKSSISFDELPMFFSGALLYALLEWSAVVLAMVATLISFLHYRANGDVTIPVIGLALMSAGILDAFHTLIATTLFVASVPPTDFISFTWTLSRVFNSSIMLIAVVVCVWLSKSIILKTTALHRFKILTITALCFTIMVGSAVIITVASSSLSTTIYPNAFVARPYDLVPLALYLCTGGFYWLWYKEKSSIFKYALLLSIIPDVVTQLHMVFGSTALFDNHFNIAHFMKVIAYGVILIGMLIDLTNRTSKENNNESQPGIFKSKATKAGGIPKVKLGKVRFPLSIKIPLAGVVLSFVISLVIGLTFYFESYNLVIDQEMEELTLEAEIIEPLITNFYRQGANDLEFLSATPPIEGIINAVKFDDLQEFGVWRQRLSSIFTELLKTKTHYKKISYIRLSSTNDVIVSSIRNTDGVSAVPVYDLQQDIDIVHLESLLSAKNERLAFSDIEYSMSQYGNEHNKNAAIYVAKTILSPGSGELFGVIAIEVDLSGFIKNLKANVLSDISFTVADNYGEIISFHNNSDYVPLNLTLQSVFPKIETVLTSGANSKEMRAFRTENSQSDLAFYSKIVFGEFEDVSPLNLLVVNDNSELILAIENMRFRALLIALSLAALSLFFSILAARKLTKPLSDMTASIISYSENGSIGKLPINETDEIGLLARSFSNLVVTIGHNSSQLKVSADEARGAMNELQAILNSIADAVITIDKKGVILAFNKAATNIFGYSEEEVIGENITILMSPEIAVNHDRYLETYAQTSNSSIIGVGRELAALRKSGEIFPMFISISEVENDKGVIYTGLIRDITESKILDAEKKRILKEAKNSSWRLNFALSAPQIGVWDKDLISGRVHWDDRMYSLYKAPSKNRTSAKELFRKSIHPDDIDNVRGKIEYAIKTTKSVQYQHRIVLQNGATRYIEGHAQVMVDERGNKVKVVGTNRDITEQQNIQELKQNALDMAEESLRLKSEFLASMSHEIRTPMNGVLGMLGLLEQSQLTKQQKHHIQLANSSAQSLLILINDILDFSKIEAGKLDLEILDFDLRSQLGELAESMAIKAQDKGLELILDLTGVTHSHVRGDPSRIRQILTNLVGNAIKFTTEGEVVIRASVVEINQRLRLNCSVSDTGIGVPANKVKTLFDSFTQVDASTTRKFGGTGLGLAIVKQLCELMGGRIEVVSELNKGSCFTLNICLEKSRQSTLVMPTISIRETEILIVDDNITNLEVLKGQLELWGARVTEAHDGFEALNRIEKEPPGKFSVAILDMQMPGMNGAALGKSLLESPNTANTKLIMMTSMSERGDAAYFADLGFSAYFPKPATTSDLFDALTIVLDDSDALNSAQPLVTHHHLKSIHRQNRRLNLPQISRILLVEDNRINQAVLLGVLDNINLTADVANNGAEAITLLKNSPEDMPYKVIIMDCQMPELDGYEATIAIRNNEAGERYNKVPIIAMTANAMKGDEEKCLAAGMNDYTTKPVNAELIQEKLCTWLGVRCEDESIENYSIETADEKQSDVHSVPAGPVEKIECLVWQKQGFMKRIRNNKELAKKLIQLFINEAPELADKLVDAIDKGSIDDALSLAHKIKGSAKNLGGEKLAEITELIEHNSSEGNDSLLADCKQELRTEMNVFIKEISEFSNSI